VSQAHPSTVLRSLAAPSAALEAELPLRQFQSQLKHRQLSTERRSSSGDRQRASLEAPSTPPPAQPPPPLAAARSAPAPFPPANLPSSDVLQRIADRMQPSVLTSPRSCHRRSISKPGTAVLPTAVAANPAQQAATAKSQPPTAAALQQLLQHTQQPCLHGLEAFLLAAVAGWLISSTAHKGAAKEQHL
jgi:hypothetical protein